MVLFYDNRSKTTPKYGTNLFLLSDLVEMRRMLAPQLDTIATLCDVTLQMGPIPTLGANTYPHGNTPEAVNEFPNLLLIFHHLPLDVSVIRVETNQ